MNTKLVNSAAGVINAALGQDRTAAGIALALESAQLLMSPETVAELEQLRCRVAELEKVNAGLDDLRIRALDKNDQLRARIAELLVERHSTNESLDNAVRELRTPYAERARRETDPGRRQAWRMLAQAEESERVANALLSPEAARSADKLTRLPGGGS
jgi:predicted nuclease with TOPRIM domain